MRTALADTEDRLLVLSITNILWKEGLKRAEHGGSFPRELKISTKEGTFRISARLTISSEDTRLNLNKTDEGTLFFFLLDLGIEEKRARVMAESLLDWRDSDNFHRLNGAEKEFYLPRGYRPRNGPLESLSEVVYVRGFDPYVFWLEPGLYRWLTIYAGDGSTIKLSSDEDQEICLEEGKVYRLETVLKFSKKTLRYLEIFRYKSRKRKKLFCYIW